MGQISKARVSLVAYVRTHTWFIALGRHLFLSLYLTVVFVSQSRMCFCFVRVSLSVSRRLATTCFQHVQSGLWIARDHCCSASCGIVREDHVRRPSLALMYPFRQTRAAHYKLSASEYQFVLVTSLTVVREQGTARSISSESRCSSAMNSEVHGDTTSPGSG
jgi:hypothetical protein